MFADTFPYQASPVLGQQGARSRTTGASARRRTPGGRAEAPPTSPAMLPHPAPTVTPRRRLPRTLRSSAASRLAAVVVVAACFSLRVSDDASRARPGRHRRARRARRRRRSPPSPARAEERSRSCRPRVAARPDDAEAQRPARHRLPAARPRDQRPVASTPRRRAASGGARSSIPSSLDAILGAGLARALAPRLPRRAGPRPARPRACRGGGSPSALGDHRRRAGRARPLPRGLRDLRRLAEPAPGPRRLRPPVLRARAAGRPRARHRPHAAGRAAPARARPRTRSGRASSSATCC